MDYREQMQRDHLHRWEQDDLFLGDGEMEARLRCNLHNEIVTLEPETIMEFYGLLKKPEDDDEKENI